MKDKKRVYKLFLYYDYTGMEKFLEKMALKGWMLESSVRYCIWEFCRCEPKKVKFAVSYHPVSSPFDTVISEEQQEFMLLAEHQGWRHAASGEYIEFYYNESEDALPLETDAVIFVDNIKRRMNGRVMPVLVLSLVISTMFLWTNIARVFTEPAKILLDELRLDLFPLFVILFIDVIMELGSYIVWYHKAKKAAETDGFVPTKSFSAYLSWLMILIIAFSLYDFARDISFGNYEQVLSHISYYASLIGAWVIIVSINRFMRKKKADKELSMGITFAVVVVWSIVSSIAMYTVLPDILIGFDSVSSRVVRYEYGGKTWFYYDDELPLDLTDLGEYDVSMHSGRIHTYENIFATEYYIARTPRIEVDGHRSMPYLKYTIIIPKMDSLYEPFKEDLYDDSRYVPDDAQLWNADEAYKVMGNNKYLLCYDYGLVTIEFGFDVTDAQKRIAGEILSSYPI